MKKLLLTIVVVALTVNALSQNNYRDVVHLKDGSIIKGIIIEQVPNEQIKIETSDGSVFVHKMNEIAKISKEKISESQSSRSNSDQDFTSPTAKGKMIVSGSTNLSYSSVTNEQEYQGGDYEIDINEFSFKPSIGWFVADGFAIGLTIDYESTKQEDDRDEYKNSGFLIGPSVIYYFGDSNIKPFIQGEYMFGNNKQEYNSDEEKIKMNGWGLGAGVAFFLNKNISLDLGLGYTNISGEYEDEYIDEDIEQTIKGFSLNGGISVYF